MHVFINFCLIVAAVNCTKVSVQVWRWPGKKHDITAALRSGSDVEESGRRWVGHTTNTTATVSQEIFCSFV